MAECTSIQIQIQSNKIKYNEIKVSTNDHKTRESWNYNRLDEMCVLGDVCCAVYFENYISPLRGDRGRRNGCKTWTWLFKIFWNNSLSALAHSASKSLSSVYRNQRTYLLLLTMRFIVCLTPDTRTALKWQDPVSYHGMGLDFESRD